MPVVMPDSIVALQNVTGRCIKFIDIVVAMNGKTTDEIEVILPFDRRSQPLAYQKLFHAVLGISPTLSN